MNLTKILLSFLACIACSLVASAQTAKTIKFDTRDEGEEKGIHSWGLDGTWLNFYNPRASKKNADGLIDFIRIGFYLHEETNRDGSLSAGQIEMLDQALKYVHVVDDKMPIKLSPNNMKGIIDWYKDSDGSADINRWLNVMERTKEYVESKGHSVISVEVFNEPDFKKWNMGDKEDLDRLFRKIKSWDVLRVGPSTLSTTPAASWYESIKSNIEVGATHTLGGTMQDYIDFIRLVKPKNQFMNPEVHALVEVIVGAEEGMDSVCWWDQINIERAAFMRASKGKRIAYLGVTENWSAACVYRDPDGVLHGFASTNERTNGKPTIYNFVCEDTDATYYINGNMDKGVFLEKGEPFRVEAKIASDEGKGSLTKWFTIVPKNAEGSSSSVLAEQPRPAGAAGDPIIDFKNGAPVFGMHIIPGTIEAENYDFLPDVVNGQTYRDNSTGNRRGSGKYRTDDVDITELQGGGYAITELVKDEWTSYTVEVMESGNYDIAVRYAAKAEGAIAFAFDAIQVTESLVLPETLNQQMETYTVARNIPLEKGVQSMHLIISGGQASFMVDRLSIEASQPEGPLIEQVAIKEPAVVEIIQEQPEIEMTPVKIEAPKEQTESNQSDDDLSSKLLYLIIAASLGFILFSLFLLKGRK